MAAPIAAAALLFVAWPSVARAAEVAVIHGNANVTLQESPGATVVGAVNNYTLTVNSVSNNVTETTNVIKTTTIQSSLTLEKLGQLLEKKLAPLATIAGEEKVTAQLAKLDQLTQLLADVEEVRAAQTAAQGWYDRMTDLLSDIDTRLANADIDAVEARRAELDALRTKLARAGKRFWIEGALAGDIEPFQSTHRRGMGPRLLVAVDLFPIGNDASFFVAGSAGYSWGSLRVTYLDPAGTSVSSVRQDDGRLLTSLSLGLHLWRTSDLVVAASVSGGIELFSTDGTSDDTTTWRSSLDLAPMLWLTKDLLVSGGVSLGARGVEVSEKQYSGFGAEIQSGPKHVQFVGGAHAGLAFAL